MHCDSPALAGGENALLDHEIAYIYLRDENPDFISALIQNDVLTIPPNVENGIELRATVSGPVFSTDTAGNLHMRYSARQKNIVWNDNKSTRQATEFITDMLNKNTTHIFRHRFAAGEGIVCNNVLHNRTAFDDSPDQQRLHFRARYYDRLKDIDGGGEENNALA